MGRQGGGQTAPAAHPVAQIIDHILHPSLGRRLDEEAQGPIHVLSGTQHHRQFTDHPGHLVLGQPAAASQVGRRNPANRQPFRRVDAQRDMALSLQLVDDAASSDALITPRSTVPS